MTFNEAIQRAVAYGFGALSVGAGTMVLSVSRNDAVQDTKIVALQNATVKIDSINETVNKVSSKVDILNQKFDDAKEAALLRK